MRLLTGGVHLQYAIFAVRLVQSCQHRQLLVHDGCCSCNMWEAAGANLLTLLNQQT